MIEVEYLRHIDEQRYNEFLYRVSDSHIFHTPEWKKVIERSFNLKPYYIIAKNSNGTIVGALPFFYVKKLTKKKLTSLPFSIYGGVIATDLNCINSLIQELFKLKETLSCDFVEIKQPPNNQYNILLEKNSLRGVQIRVDQYIPLKPPIVLWNKLKRSCYTAIKRAKKKGIIVKRINDKNYLNKIYNLEVLTRKRLGIPIPRFDYYLNLWKFLYPKYLEIFVSEKDDDILSSDIFLKFRNTILGMHNASTIEGRRLGANTLMIWEAIKWGYQEGYKIFDFGSTPDISKEGVSPKYDGLFTYKN
ncbi:MAG TPA: GNAT family N-acetyltransferase, partial [Candidatus Atribacteria bacterium]|nr:GNAT family N-acetyltransferase [Candidatus Atribacteria bacterium]